MIFAEVNRLALKLALFAIFFASLAPTVSHALASQNDANYFLQTLCNSAGETITIKVVTSKGQQLQTALDVKPSQQPHEIAQHLNHCPFCANPSAGLAVIPQHHVLLARLNILAQKQVYYQAVALPDVSVITPPAQAPPLFA